MNIIYFLFSVFFVVCLSQGLALGNVASLSEKRVLPAIGEQLGHSKISFASPMNKALVVVFLTDQKHVSELIESGLTLDGEFVPVSPLAVPSTQVTVSAVHPNELLE